MRTLERNKVTLWVTRKTVGTERKDADGFFTGDYDVSFTTPYRIRIALSPSNSDISEEIFGKDSSFDMITSSNEVVLNEDDYIFYNEPIGNYDTTYDFTVKSIAHSLNTYSYGLRARTK